MFNLSLEEEEQTFLSPPSPQVQFSRIPNSINWVKLGGVTKVKNQGKCGSCYAFAAVGMLENVVWKRTGKLYAFSEQNLVDCVTHHGCKGVHVKESLAYIKRNGIALERKYSYTGRASSCRRVPKYRIIQSLRMSPRGNEKVLKKIVSKRVTTCAINAASHGFKFYKKGVFYDPKCKKSPRKHAVCALIYY